MALDERARKVILTISKERILEEASTLAKGTQPDRLVLAANLAIESIIGRIALSDEETLADDVKRAQTDAYEILENTQAMVAICCMAEQCNDME